MVQKRDTAAGRGSWVGGRGRQGRVLVKVEASERGKEGLNKGVR